MQPITADEDAEAVRRMKLGEAAGPDIGQQRCVTVLEFDLIASTFLKPGSLEDAACRLAGQHDHSNLKEEWQPSYMYQIRDNLIVLLDIQTSPG